MEERIELDLYTLYMQRMNGISVVSVEHFYFYLRLLLACDVTHDFSKPRGDTGKKLWLNSLGDDSKGNDFKDKILTDNANRVIRDCKGLVNTSEPLSLIEIKVLRSKQAAKVARLTNETQLVDRLKELTKNDDQAKKTADAIHDILHLTEKNVQSALLRSNECDNIDVIDLIKTLDITKSAGRSHSKETKYNITIDATSDKTNLTPFFSDLLNRAHKLKNKCPVSNPINIINSYATDYDASNDDALTKIFTKLGFFRGELANKSLEFFITCNKANVFQGTLEKVGGKVKLTIKSYFKTVFPGGLERSSGSTDSVNGITEDMLKSYNTRRTDNDEIFNLTIFKTMGDFLQVMTHLHLHTKFPQEINVFITFDILCAKIAGILDKNVFYEKKFTSDADKISAGLHTFFNLTAEAERTAAMVLMDLNEMFIIGEGSQQKRAQEPSEDRHFNPILLAAADMVLAPSPKRKRITRFGKKKQKVKNLPNKSIMTKLKSVGIKITKKQGKRRVYLSRPELIKRATAFKNLQNRAKKLKVRIMYKNKNGKYVYKTAKRLMNDIKRQMKKPVKKQMKKPVKKQMKKPVKKQMKKPVKKSNVKQMKQRFG